VRRPFQNQKAFGRSAEAGTEKVAGSKLRSGAARRERAAEDDQRHGRQAAAACARTPASDHLSLLPVGGVRLEHIAADISQ
jgi:hypothetical protein